MVIEGLKQGSVEWREWRRKKIGGSDANIIASWFLDDYDYPYEKWPGAAIYKLWALKTGSTAFKEEKDRSFGDYVDPKTHGKNTEDAARDWYEIETGEFAPAVCMEHDLNRHIAASLDGYVAGQLAVEIKCPKEPDDHRAAKEGHVPDKYFAQFQHNLFVANVPVLHYVSYFQGEGVVVPIVPDAEFLDRLRDAEEEFWRWVTSDKFPLVGGGARKMVDEVDAQGRPLKNTWGHVANLYLGLQEKQRALDKEERYLKRWLVRLMEGAYRAEGAGIKASLRIQAPTKVPAFERGGGLVLTVSRT